MCSESQRTDSILFEELWYTYSCSHAIDVPEIIISDYWSVHIQQAKSVQVVYHETARVRSQT